MAIKKGDILVVKKGVPAHFRNIKPGTFWKALSDERTNGGVTVGDQYHEGGFKSMASYFHVLDSFTKDQIRNTAPFASDGVETDLSARLKATEAFSKNTKTAKTAFPGYTRVKVNGVRVYIPTGVAQALASKGSDKLVQRKLVEKLRGL